MTAIAEINEAMAGTIDAVRGSLVSIRTRHGGGAGIIWRGDGLIVSNAHVTRRGPVGVLLPDGSTVEGRVVAIDAEVDLAAVQLSAQGLRAAAIGDSQAVRAGELVLAHGHPWGVPGAVTSGVVIGVGADWPGLPAVNGLREWLVVNMRLRPGNSGGPVLDMAGKVVGVAAVMAGPSVGMAVPSHVVERFVRAHVPEREAVEA